METKEGIDFTVLIIIATMGVLILIFFIILMVLLYQKNFLATRNQMIDMEKRHQKKLLDATLEIAEHERRKIATNLHDDIGIMFNVLKLNMARLKKNRGNAETVDKIVQESNTSIDHSLDIVRAIYRDIVPPTLSMAGLVRGLKELCKQLNTSTGIEIALESNEEIIAIEKNTELQLYRLIKEVLNNTLKHAGPRLINILIDKQEHTLTVRIEHDGAGITTEKIQELARVSKGIGLKSILTRTELINATIDFLIPMPGKALVEIRMLLV